MGDSTTHPTDTHYVWAGCVLCRINRLLISSLFQARLDAFKAVLLQATLRQYKTHLLYQM